MQNYMTTGENGLNLIKSFEGLRLQAYPDSTGLPTVGFGTTVINGQPVQLGMTITEDQATSYLQTDLQHAESIVNQVVQVDITQNQFDALISFTYNLGEGNLEKSSLLRLLNQGNPMAASEEFVKWDRAGGQVLEGLLRRRTAERDLFLS